MNTILLESFWTICSAITTSVAALATVLYVFLTYKILRETSNTSKLQVKIADAQIYYQVTKILNSAEANELFEFIENTDFHIDAKGDMQILQARTSIKSSDLQRLILDPIEDLAKYWQDELISLDSIDTGFGFKILAVGSNTKIVDYINFTRRSYKSNQPYEGLESLYLEIRKRVSVAELVQYPNYFGQSHKITVNNDGEA